MTERRGGPDYYGGSGPDDWEAERRSWQQRRRPLTGAEALLRITEFRAVFGDECDEDDE